MAASKYNFFESYSIRRTLVEWLISLQHCLGMYPDIPLEHGLSGVSVKSPARLDIVSTIMARTHKQKLIRKLWRDKLFALDLNIVRLVAPTLPNPEELQNKKYLKDLRTHYEMSLWASNNPGRSAIIQLTENRNKHRGLDNSTWAALYALHRLSDSYYGWLPQPVISLWAAAMVRGMVNKSLTKNNCTLNERVDEELLRKMRRGGPAKMADCELLVCQAFKPEHYQWILDLPKPDELQEPVQELITSPYIAAFFKDVRPAKLEDIQTTASSGTVSTPHTQPVNLVRGAKNTGSGKLPEKKATLEVIMRPNDPPEDKKLDDRLAAAIEATIHKINGITPRPESASAGLIRPTIVPPQVRQLAGGVIKQIALAFHEASDMHRISATEAEKALDALKRAESILDALLLKR